MWIVMHANKMQDEQCASSPAFGDEHFSCHRPWMTVYGAVVHMPPAPETSSDSPETISDFPDMEMNLARNMAGKKPTEDLYVRLLQSLLTESLR